jgi:predicted lipoprotein with Yx(FWY)xxD motif
MDFLIWGANKSSDPGVVLLTGQKTGPTSRLKDKIMMMKHFVLGAALSLIAGSAFAVGDTQDTAKGKVFATPDGMTLYTFDKDVDGVSACYNACATQWPPFLAKEGASATGDFGLTTREDGAEQWTYKGQPLYLWMNDRKPGDVTGDGVGGVWHLATP